MQDLRFTHSPCLPMSVDQCGHNLHPETFEAGWEGFWFISYGRPGNAALQGQVLVDRLA